jgi:3-(3-hydroxy-phenyl)propionate hydroxylase
MVETFDVVIVGYGPTGEVLANILGMAGHSVCVMESEQDIFYSPKAVHFDDEIMRVFQYIGLSETIKDHVKPFTTMEFLRKPGGKTLCSFNIGSQDRRYGHEGAFWFHQPTLERDLRDGASQFENVKALNGVKAVRIEQQDGKVTVVYKNTTTGEKNGVTARYAVGCDGGRSFVRNSMNIPMTSWNFDQPWVVVDVKSIDGKEIPGLPERHRQILDPAQPVTYVPIGGPYYEWQFMVTDGRPKDSACDPFDIREKLKAFVDLEKIEIIRIAYYTFHALYAEKWRKGNVFIAGDAAHMMPPFLGQGLCSAIRDAHSLGWRLDMVLKGLANDSLLDSYQTERLPHVQALIKGASFLGRMIQTRNRAAALIRDRLLFPAINILPSLKHLSYGYANRKLPLKGGFLSSTSKLSGSLFIQPQVCDRNGRTVLLDEVLGKGFALISKEGVLDGYKPLIEELTEKLPMVFTVVGTRVSNGISGITPCYSIGLNNWFSEQGVDFAFIRPDRIIYDAGRAEDFETKAGKFLDAFPFGRKAA